MKSWRNSFRSSRNIGILSIFLFAAVAASMLFSTYYMNTSIRAEELAQTRRNQYRQEGENLADASDYLTAEVRYFAVTGDTQHLYNYWYEIRENQQRERAIQDFESNNPPDEEEALLEEAKQYSDLLVETETCSMKLVLTSIGIQNVDEAIQNLSKQTTTDFAKNAEEQRLSNQIMQNMKIYIEEVLQYQLPADLQSLSREEMSQRAIDILYDDNYENYKTQIMTPIEEFQRLMNNRLDAEVEVRKANTRLATAIQIILALAALGAIGWMIWLINRLYIRPLKRYTREIQETGYLSDDEESTRVEVDSPNGALAILEAKIVPVGANELVHLADAFNSLIDQFFQELCQRKNAEESMRKAWHEAELANKAKSVFLAQMTHELRTPLNAIDGYTYMLERSVLAEKQKNYVQNIRYSSQGLLELINQILDFSKIESGNLELEEITFDLRRVLSEVQGMMENQAEKKGLFLKVHADEAIPEALVGDPLRVRQLLVNLVGNAIKFTESGGVTISANVERKSGKVCCIRMNVVDTGIGIKEEVRERIFQPFTQSDSSVTRKYGGTGLGLPICSQIIALASDGAHHLHLRSEDGKGSDFFFRMDFQAADSEELLREGGRADIEIPDFTGHSILLTDDNVVNIQVETEILRMMGLRVLRAASGVEALDILEKTEGIELILMDIRMPGMDGYETSRKIRALSRYEKTPILALTADAMAEVRAKVRQSGMQECLLKPVQPEQLGLVLSRYLSSDTDTCKGGELPADDSWKKMSDALLDRNSEKVLFDKRQSLRQLGDNKQALLSIIESFLELHQSDPEKLDILMEKQEYQEAENLVHTLKGVSGNLWCRPLSKICKELQYELQGLQKMYVQKDSENQKHYSYILLRLNEKVDYFHSCWDKTVPVLHAALKELKEERSDGGDCDSLHNLREQIVKLCEDYDSEAVVILEQHMADFEKSLGGETAKQLKYCSMSYDFEGIINCLKS